MAGRKRRLQKRKCNIAFKAQSAMEYLMTYGWAILTIAIVMVGLFGLGVFNLHAGPRALPGSCKVIRNNVIGAQLTGLCNNEPPMYVTKLSSFAAQGGGLACMNMTAPTLNVNSGGYNTVSFWMYWDGTDNESLVGFPGYFTLLDSGCIGVTTGNSDVYGVSSSGFAHSWTMVTQVMYNGPFAVNDVLYINGVQQNSYQCLGAAHSGTAKENLLIGSSTGSKYKFSGQVTNVQVYNASLDANTVKAMYGEGIGGAPLELSTLVAWLPLNGDIVDYGGYSNPIVISSSSCSLTYSSSYTLP